MQAQPVLTARGLSKRFGAVQALDGVDFTLHAGEIRAVCGENGAGKSTFIKLLTGVYQPDAGAVRVGAREGMRSPREAQAAGIALVAQELSVCPDLSVEDNMWLGTIGVPLFHRRAALRQRARQVLDLLGMQTLPLDTPLTRLSLGERQMVEIARALSRDAEVLLLDEPTATLSDTEIAKVLDALRALRREGRAILYITHRMGEVFDLCDSVTVLRNGKHVATRPVAGLNRRQLVELMLGHAPAAPAARALATGAAPQLEVAGLSVPGRVHEASFGVPAGAVACIVGQVGSGAEDVVRAIAGLEYTAMGSVAVRGRELTLGSPAAAARKDVLYVSGDRAGDGLFQELSVEENMVATRLRRYARGGVLQRQALRRKALELAERVRVDARRLRSRTGDLSGGNQQKIAFGRCIDRGEPGAIVMVEPTRGIDVGAREDIYALMQRLAGAGHALLVASTDLEEVLAIGDSVVTMFRGRVVGRYARGEIDLAGLVADITHPAGAAA